MARIYMLRTPGTKDFPTLAHLKEAHVYDGLPKEDVERLYAAGLAEEFDEANDDHAASLEAYEKQDAKKAVLKSAVPAPAHQPGDYAVMTLDQLHAEATKRDLEDRSKLTTKELLIRALVEDDKEVAKGKKK